MVRGSTILVPVMIFASFSLNGSLGRLVALSLGRLRGIDLPRCVFWAAGILSLECYGQDSNIFQNRFMAFR